MKQAIVELESISAYSQSKHYSVPHLEKESAADYEVRTWRERCHTDENGKLFIPPMAFKNCMAEAAKFLSLKIQGQGSATWTKHFEAGLLVTDSLELDITKEKVEGEWLFVPSDGKRGGGTRVSKCFPLIRRWAGAVTFHIIDDKITRDVFEQVLKCAGQLIGIGRFRPRNCGYYGRFRIKSLKWSEAA